MLQPNLLKFNKRVFRGCCDGLKGKGGCKSVEGDANVVGKTDAAADAFATNTQQWIYNWQGWELWVSQLTRNWLDCLDN